MTGGLLGGIEAGGTKFVAVVGTGPDDIRHRLRV
ncbi:MAG: fructokinase, partial [Acidimicrobiia bacterium]|nr:fructokinase [Acidimicrobiia bacterium]